MYQIFFKNVISLLSIQKNSKQFLNNKRQTLEDLNGTKNRENTNVPEDLEKKTRQFELKKSQEKDCIKIYEYPETNHY